MRSLKRWLHYLGRRFVPVLYAKYLKWRNAGISQSEPAWLDWDARIADVLACPDNTKIERVPDAGKVSGKWQTMHNGLRVLVDGYYGAGVTRILEVNRGSHEPQEELVFDSILAKMKPGAIMVECGAYWGFYSLCFCRAVPGARAFLIEPDLYNLHSGRRNFAKNGFKAKFTNAYVGSKPGQADDGATVVAIDEFTAQHHIDLLDILHADIQGAEVQMLEGASELLDRRAARFVFISTHTQALHEECLRCLAQRGYQIHSELGMAETFSFDGLIVAHRAGEDVSGIPVPSRKSAVTQNGTITH